MGDENNLQQAAESTENLITWLYEQGSFVPFGKIVGEEKFSIVSDYLGTPSHAYDDKGGLVWERELDVYGSLRKGDNSFVPFLYQGQYVDVETGLAYNRFRYYDPQIGNFISQDPIGLQGGTRLYGYVSDPNGWIDILGLMARSIPTRKGHHIVPHAAATNLNISPFNSEFGVPSYYFKPDQVDPHGRMHGDGGMRTRYPLTMKQINKQNLTPEKWLGMLETHYNNPSIQDIRGDLRIVDRPGKPGILLAENVSPAQAWNKAKEWADAQRHVH
ncbi:hypothetical protein GNY06_04780 [Elizabethkingia argentiflava]|uniref:Teneurin-like YD-shell domain-containing protein n=1 Tax=Elizabethkingia argenteiflava TaxID=2681556 RepID=A0A845PWA2_9FLAO|nr:RHS repeat-associated core domain-containing protein [Elizabethkingia argenteiflava]NAW50727.1 hypothetical protein [Elizabethkingia argenteiflava]